MESQVSCTHDVNISENSTTPLVSVIMPNYNYKPFLVQAIESILNQSVSDIELIIIDDASTDGSCEIIDSYIAKDKRISAIYHTKNSGISKSMNNGIAACRGKFIAFMNSDDIWIENKLSEQLKILMTDEKLMVWSNAEIIDRHGNDTGQSFTQLHEAIEKKKSGKVFDELLRGNFIMLSSFMALRSILNKKKFYKKIKYLNDWLFFTELAKDYEYCFIDAPLVKYRIHGNNTNTDVRGYILDALKISDIFFCKYRSLLSKELTDSLHYRVATSHEALAKYGNARLEILKLIISNPLGLLARYYFKSRFMNKLTLGSHN